MANSKVAQIELNSQQLSDDLKTINAIVSKARPYYELQREYLRLLLGTSDALSNEEKAKIQGFSEKILKMLQKKEADDEQKN